jgi:hypothetical protein
MAAITRTCYVFGPYVTASGEKLVAHLIGLLPNRVSVLVVDPTRFLGGHREGELSIDFRQAAQGKLMPSSPNLGEIGKPQPTRQGLPPEDGVPLGPVEVAVKDASLRGPADDPRRSGGSPKEQQPAPSPGRLPEPMITFDQNRQLITSTSQIRSAKSFSIFRKR